MSDIQPIETTYKGHKFRSRLEARWAVFFDALKIRWVYEHEGYETPTGRYLPDFWLPDVYMRGEALKGVLFEAKPENFPNVHEELAFVAEKLNISALLAVGFDFTDHSWYELYQMAPWWDDGMMFYVCACGVCKFDFCCAGDDEYVCPICKCAEFDTMLQRVQDAYDKAIKYRFW
jgi:hypothetical protein